ncbi:reverse transcriptase domain-containing protein [Novipirellula artificiosorum]|uniref:Group II intron-encoded protein LtrA n=1 Tax=Novipirellula artificiosorum TaxID=2528016 RepID=A0A5C6CFU8_9BACT|nr:reverse transcriptase domain-containing protein [Novipirellula artificiosorum]TWU23510.1 Group II intron-encoded protein LtrA [Novipirellula artificiosorum]
MIDRLVQQAIFLVLTPIFDPEFSESSFGFRPHRSAHEAIHLVQQHLRAGYRWCVDIDLSKFFDTVQHDVLMHRVGRKVRDKRLLRLIGNYLRAGVMIDTQFHPSSEGTMQGGPLSPFLSNVLLDDFDKEMESRGHRFVRYADDFLVFSKTEQSATRVFASVERYLTGKLKLVINREKSGIRPAEATEYLGYCFHGTGGRFKVSGKKLRKFKDRVKELTRRKRGVSIQRRLRSSSSSVSSPARFVKSASTVFVSEAFNRFSLRIEAMCLSPSLPRCIPVIERSARWFRLSKSLRSSAVARVGPTEPKNTPVSKNTPVRFPSSSYSQSAPRLDSFTPISSSDQATGRQAVKKMQTAIVDWATCILMLVEDDLIRRTAGITNPRETIFNWQLAPPTRLG